MYCSSGSIAPSQDGAARADTQVRATGRLCPDLPMPPRKKQKQAPTRRSHRLSPSAASADADGAGTHPPSAESLPPSQLQLEILERAIGTATTCEVQFTILSETVGLCTHCNDDSGHTGRNARKRLLETRGLRFLFLSWHFVCLSWATFFLPWLSAQKKRKSCKDSKWKVDRHAYR